MLRLSSSLFAVLCLAATVFAQPATQPAHHVSEPIYKEVRPIKSYVHVSTTTTLNQIKDTVTKQLPPLVQKHKSLINGPLIFIYNGVTPQPDRPFDLQMGFPAPEGTKDLGEYKDRPLDTFKCVSVYYTGPLEHIDKAYQKVFPALFQMGYKPTGESREIYLYWIEAEDSPNNVAEIQIGVTK